MEMVVHLLAHQKAARGDHRRLTSDWSQLLNTALLKLIVSRIHVDLQQLMTVPNTPVIRRQFDLIDRNSSLHYYKRKSI